MSENIPNTLKPLPALVPQIYFDLIARVVPGAFLLLCAYFIVFNDPQKFFSVLNGALEQFKKQTGAKTIIFFSFIFASYVVSVILEGLYRIIKKPFYNKWKKFLGKQIIKTEKVALEYINMKCFSEINIENNIFPDMFIMYDSIRLLNPATGSRLVKLRAEYYMARVIVMGLFVLLTINLLITPHQYNIASHSTDIVLFLLVIVFITMFFQRRKTFLWGIHNHWVLLNEEEILQLYCYPTKKTPSHNLKESDIT